MEGLELMLVVAAAAGAFTVSASAGLGGSLILVPALALVLGAKEGIALAALLLAANNVVKVCAYRKSIPLAASAGVIALTVLGAGLGATLLVTAPAAIVEVAVIVSIGLSLASDRYTRSKVRRAGAVVLGFASGAVSGFSGTSGPLKGLALRHLGFDRFHLVGAASAVSLAGDLTKTAVFAEASLLDTDAARFAGVLVPVMIASTLLGRRVNRQVGERGYAILFWAVMAGYSLRLVV